MAKKSNARKPIQAYAFVDTNIFLDFYRAKTEATISLLRKLEQVKDRIICTYQVEMEFLKNRQEQILNISRDINLSVDIDLPAVLSETRFDAPLARARGEMKKRKPQLDKRIGNLLASPGRYDPVFDALESIFNSESAHVLTRDMPVRHRMKRLAWRRFVLGYPPRKSRDTSMGDALNWEWIVHCGSFLTGRFIIVSRDSDFGCVHKGRCFLNDALKDEFRDRVGQKAITYTNKLSDALRALEIHVTREEEESEQETLDIEKQRAELAKVWAELYSEQARSVSRNALAHLLRNYFVKYDES